MWTDCLTSVCTLHSQLAPALSALCLQFGILRSTSLVTKTELTSSQAPLADSGGAPQQCAQAVNKPSHTGRPAKPSSRAC